jgi:anti-anti-sigma factor
VNSVRIATHPFDLRAERLNGFVRLFVAGGLDLSTAGRLERSLARLQQERATIIIDLARLDFIGADGLQVLVDASRRARSTGGSLLIVNCSAPARRVFDLTSTVHLLDAPAVAELFDDDREWTPMPIVADGPAAPSVADR